MAIRRSWARARRRTVLRMSSIRARSAAEMPVVVTISGIVPELQVERDFIRITGLTLDQTRFAFAFLGERPSFREWSGIAMVAGGVLLLAFKR